jgi:predicted MFS family arabinose efflux permease
MIPIITLYWLDVGLSMQDIFLLQVLFSVAIVVLEVPSGYFADRFGRKYSLVIGMVFGTLGYLVYAVAGSFWEFAAAELLLAVSISFISGADSAFLYDTLKQYASTDQHTKVEGRMLALARISEATAAILGGLIASFYSLSLVLYIQFIVMACSIPLALMLTEPAIEVGGRKRKDLQGALRYAFRENKTILHMNIFTGLVFSSGLLLVWMAQPYWQEIGVPLIWFGALWASYNAVTAFGSYIAHRLQGMIGFSALFGISGLMVGLVFTVLSFGIGFAAVIVMSVAWLLRGIFHPIMLDYLHRQTPSDIRATVISLNSLYTRLFFSIVSPFVGWVADVWTLETAFLASGVITGTLVIISFFFLQQSISRQKVGV